MDSVVLKRDREGEKHFYHQSEDCTLISGVLHP